MGDHVSETAGALPDAPVTAHSQEEANRDEGFKWCEKKVGISRNLKGIFILRTTFKGRETLQQTQRLIW